MYSVPGVTMSEESERMLTLLQELAALKDAKDAGTRADATERRKRRSQIAIEMKQLAARVKENK
jgi:hypothetical protein